MTGSFYSYSNFSNLELVELENKLDYHDPDLINEIVKRADIFEDGLLDKFEKCDCWEDWEPLIEKSKKILENEL